MTPVVHPDYCDDQRCRHLARWAYPSIKIRNVGESWRDYRLCVVHAAELTSQRRALP